MFAQSFVGTLLVHVQLKLHLFFSVMNNSSNAFSHQLITTWCIGLLRNHPHCELNSSSAVHDVVKIAESIEQVMDMGKIEGSTMNSITMIRNESGDDSEDGKP